MEKFEIMAERIRTIQIIHMAICVGVILVYIFVGQFTIEQLKGQEIDSNEYVYIVVPFVAFFLSNFVYKNQLKKVDANARLEGKFPVILTASLIRWSILEGAAFLVLFIAPDLVIFGIVLILYLISLRPTERKFRSEFLFNGQ